MKNFLRKSVQLSAKYSLEFTIVARKLDGEYFTFNTENAEIPRKMAEITREFTAMGASKIKMHRMMHEPGQDTNGRDIVVVNNA